VDGPPAQTRDGDLAAGRGESIREHQLKDGSWRYKITTSEEAHQDTGTCVGLILLALGQGTRDGGQPFLEDPAVKKAVTNLGTIVNRPHDKFTRRPLGDRFQSWAICISFGLSNARP